jgi:uncharacterized delta-60 repeat protein
LASGFTSTGIYKSVLLRLNSNGSLDSSFAYHGMNIFNFAPGQNFIFHSGGKLLLGGSNGTFGAFMQFTATGIIDSTFGNKGLAILDSVRYIRSFAIQWDGKIIGINPDLYTNWYELVRVTPDGLFDTTFGNHGIVRSYFDSIAVLQTAYSIAIQHGGKVIVGGISQENINPNIYYYYSLARFNTGLNCPSPVALFTYQSDTSAVQFTDHSSSATGWHWSFGDSTYSIEQNPVHTYPAIGKYFNCLNISDSCGSGQFCDSVKLIPNGIPASVQNTVKIFPNPVNDYLNLEFPATYSTISGIIQIRNIIGEKLLEMEINTQRIIIDTKKFTPGAYQLIILSDDKIICKRFIKL